MRIVPALFLTLVLAACKGGSQSHDAVRQGVVDYLTKAGINVPAMDITLSSVKFDGNQADATVNMGLKGSGSTAMTMNYHLEQKDNKWVVVGKQDSGQHGAMAPGAGSGTPAGGENPHAGGAAPAPGGGGKMPSPEDLPPVGKKK